MSRNSTSECLTVKNAGTANNSTLLQYDCNPVQGNNLWTWFRDSNIPLATAARSLQKTAK